jgi:integrase
MNFKPRDRDKYLFKEEFAKLVAWADKHDRRLALFIFVGGALGLRITEARTLPWAAFDRLDGERVVEVMRLKKRRKGEDGTSRRVPRRSDIPVNPATAGRLRGYVRALRKAGDSTVFPGRDGRPLSIRQATRWFKRATVGAKLNPNYSYHALRHYRGISAWEATRDIKTVSKLLGHELEETSYKYMHMSNRSLQEAVDKIEVL